MAESAKTTEKILHHALRILNGKRKDAICRKSGLGMQTLQHIATDILPLVDGLEPRKREILQLRYGLDGNGPRTLDAIGKAYGITRERVRQIQNASLKKVRQALERRTMAG